MEAIGRPVSAAGVASLYQGLLDGIVVDEGDPDPPPEGLEALVCPTLMEGSEGRVALADRILDWAMRAERHVILPSSGSRGRRPAWSRRSALRGAPPSCGRCSPTSWLRSNARERVERVILVTGEGRAEKIAMERAKRSTTPIEVLREPTDHGHSEAATLGIIRAKALGAECAALLPGDCPLLDPTELDAPSRALRRARWRRDRSPRHRHERPLPLACRRDRPRLRARQLRAPPRPRRASRLRGESSSTSRRWRSTWTRLTTSSALASLLAENPERAPLTAAALAEL